MKSVECGEPQRNRTDGEADVFPQSDYSRVAKGRETRRLAWIIGAALVANTRTTMMRTTFHLHENRLAM
jgi:hypothetical protein